MQKHITELFHLFVFLFLGGFVGFFSWIWCSSFLFTLYWQLNTITPFLLWLTFKCHLLRNLSVAWSILASSCLLSAITDMLPMNKNGAVVRYRSLAPKSFANKWQLRSFMKLGIQVLITVCLLLTCLNYYFIC